MIETVPSGTVLNRRYRIERVLGSGGFGHVYLALDLTAHQHVAVKEYLVTGSSGQEQLKHEATVLRTLRHPSLPAFQDAFIEHGRYYVVLNYIEGNDLTDLIRMARQRNEVIPIRQLISWLLSICDAVMFLHNQQPIVIHRDIKPDNIRITPSGTAVLVDLGNAKAAADGARTLFFIRHQGTPGYAPPEQYPGGSGTDARSDIYALSGTLYFALTMNEPPSVSARNQSVQQGQPNLPTLQEHLVNNPPEESPEAQAARQFRLGVSKPGKPVPRHSHHIAQLGTLHPDVLNRLNYVLHKAMALKPRDRYAYVADFARELRTVLQAIPPPPAPPTSPPPSRPIDPNSTQPDLPGIYDAIMEANERNNQGNPGAQSPTLQPTVCPRCGAQLLSQAAFCPQCGTPRNQPTNAASQQPALVSSAKKDIAAEQTLLLKSPQAGPALATYPSRDQPPISAAAGPAYLSQPSTATYHPPVMIQSQVQTFSQPSSTSHPPISKNTGFQISPGMMLFLLSSIIAVLIAIAFFIIFIVMPNRG